MIVSKPAVRLGCPVNGLPSVGMPGMSGVALRGLQPIGMPGMSGLPAVGRITMRGLPSIGHVAACVDLNAGMSGLPSIGRVALRGLPSVGGLPSIGTEIVQNPACDYPGGSFIRPGETQEAFMRRSAICSSQPEVEQATWYESLGQSLLTTYANIEVAKYAQQQGVPLRQPPAPPMTTAQKAGIGVGVVAALAVAAFFVLGKRGR